MQTSKIRMKLVVTSKRFLKHWEKFWFDADRMKDDMEKMVLAYKLRESDFPEFFKFLNGLRNVKRKGK